MKKEILIAGGTGLIGTLLVERLLQAGQSVTCLRRKGTHDEGTSKSTRFLDWDPPNGSIEQEDFSEFSSVICLNGAGIADRRWTSKRKKEILESRVQSVGLLAHCIAKSAKKPESFLCASASGYYGSSPSIVFTESSPAGSDFLSHVCTEWEAASGLAVGYTRVVRLRFGVVLSSQGGMLKRILPSFRFGLGASLGRGQQWISWIHRDDAVSAILHCLDSNAMQGPVNIVTDNPVSNDEFTHSLAQILRRPSFFRIPPGVVRLLFGEMGEALLLQGARLSPAKLLNSGFSYQYPTVEQALRKEFS